MFFAVLGWVALLGVGWDVVYIFLQSFRWDRDWPAAFQVATGIVEGAVLYALITFVGLPGLERGSVPLALFVAHYATVWFVIFIWVQGPMRVLNPYWRFHGGRLLPLVAANDRRRSTDTDVALARPVERAESAPSVVAAGLILVAVGLLAVANGILVALGAPSQDVALPAGLIFAAFGALEILIGAAILQRHPWGRGAGILVALIGAGAGSVSLVSSLGLAEGVSLPVNAGSTPLAIAVTAVVVALYVYVALTLLVEAGYFRRRSGAR
jgi:hypothetical protein